MKSAGDVLYELVVVVEVIINALSISLLSEVEIWHHEHMSYIDLSTHDVSTNYKHLYGLLVYFSY